MSSFPLVREDKHLAYSEVNPSSEARRSGLELLRILAMLAIIGYHFQTQAPWEGVATGFSRLFVNFLGSFGRSGVNVFVMIGAWFLLEKPFDSRRIIRLYCALLFYTVCGTVVGLAIWPFADQAQNVKNLLRALLPVSCSPLWFVTDYIALLFVSPLINLLARELPREKIRFLILVLLMCYVAVPAIENLLPGINTWEWFILYNDLIWLIVLYLLVAFARLHCSEALERFPAGRCFGLCVIFAVLANAAGSICSMSEGGFIRHKFIAFTEYLFWQLNSPFCLLAAGSSFLWFQRMGFASKAVNLLAKGVLGVYILHQIPVLVPHIWGFFQIKKWPDVWYVFPGCEVLAVGAIFVVCLLVDAGRRALMRPLLGSAFVRRVAEGWNAQMPR